MSARNGPTRAERKLWRSLARTRARAQTGLFLAEGAHALVDLAASTVTVERALVAEDVDEDAAVAAALQSLRARHVRVHSVPARVIDEVADTVTPQGVLAIAHIPTHGWRDLRRGVIVVLDRVQDPGNVGTVIRTAEALRATAVVCLPGTADPWSPKVVRAAGGASFRLPVWTSEFDDVREQVQRRGGEIWGADLEGQALARGSETPDTLCLVLGSEAHGLRDEVRAASHRLVRISLDAAADSLNVAVAGAILLDRLSTGEADVG